MTTLLCGCIYWEEQLSDGDTSLMWEPCSTTCPVYLGILAKAEAAGIPSTVYQL